MKTKAEPVELTPEQIEEMQRQELLCASCDNPCDVDIKEYPSNFSSKISLDEPLLGSTTAHKWHVLLCSGVSGKKWPARLEEDEESYHGYVNKVLGEVREQIPERFLLSAVSTPSEDGVDPEFECDIVIFPEGVKYKAVRREQFRELFLQHTLHNYGLTGVPSVTALDIPKPTPLEQDTWVLVCGHKLRDNKCGIAAPLLIDAFTKILEAKNLDDDVFVETVSHIGGHKFAGNVIIHSTRNQLGAVWYGRVFPYHVNAIVEKTIENQKVLEPLLRFKSKQW